MTPSRKKSETRSVFDVHTGKAASSGRSLKERVYGRNVLNLRPGFGKRHPWWMAVAFAVLVVGIFLGIRKLSTRAEVSDFFPLTCLGSWQNPRNAEGKPDTLTDASGTAIGGGIAAVYDPASAPAAQIFCGAFIPPDYQTQGSITSVGLTLVWAMPGFATTTGNAVATTTAATTTETVTTAPTSTSQNQVLKSFALFFNVAFADTTDTASTVSTSSGTNTPAPASEPTSTSAPTAAPALAPTSTGDTMTTTVATATTTTSSAAPTSTESTSTPPAATTTTEATTIKTTATTTETTMTAATTTTSTVVTLPPLTATLAPVTSTTSTASGTPADTGGGGMNVSTTTTTTTAATSTTTTSTTSTAPVFAPPPPPDSNFLKVSYSLDGETWTELARVNPDNWQNFTANLPVTSWDDLKKLQVKIEGIPTSLTQIPKVYLDGMFIEAHYEVPPPLPISLGGSGVAPAATTGAASSTVIILPPTQQPVPVNQNGNFKADQSPTFDFNLNALPAPTSAPSAAPAPEPTSSPPATSTPTSTSFIAPTSPLSFFFRNVWRGIASIGKAFIAYAQSANSNGQNQPPLPTENNPIVAQIFGPNGRLTNLQPVTLITGGNLRVILPSSGRAFTPGKYLLKLYIWQNGQVYETQSNFSWGVLVVDFDKSIYTPGDTVHAGFAVLDNAGDTICGADVSMDVSSPSGAVTHFSTADGTIVKNMTCGPNNVTNAPDYSATFKASEVGTYLVSVSATTLSGTRTIQDQFAVQNPPPFDVTRSAPVRIFPPATYKVSLTVNANSNYTGDILESVPSSFSVTANGAQQSVQGDALVLNWPVHMKKGDSVTLSYSFKAPPQSPELYKLGPLQIGSWQEARQWQIAADAITTIFITSTASTTWTVPSDWNNASNTIEVVGGGGGGATGNSNQGGGGGGGGGGAYSRIANTSLTAGNSVGVHVGGAGGTAAAGGDTWLCDSTANCTVITGSAVIIGAKGGGAGTVSTGGGGGAAASGVGSTKNDGGAGGATGSGSGSNGDGGGGGGGAAGASAAGNAGGSVSFSTTGGNGGQGDGTVGGGGGAGGNGAVGSPGSAGTEWDSSHGSGGGGGGGGTGGHGINGSNGGAGGNYGAGGGGGAEGGKASSAGGSGASGTQGIIVITYTPFVATITLGDGTQPSAVTIGPGAAATTSDVFTFVTNSGTSTLTAVTTTISTSTGVGQVQITDSSGATVYGSSTNPTSNIFSISLGSGVSIGTATTTLHIAVKPLAATAMPSPPGGAYTVTSTIKAWTNSGSYTQQGTNSTSGVITIDNQSPGNVTGAAGTAGNGQVTFTWTNSTDPDFTTTTVLRATSLVSVAPTEGTTYAVGNTIDTTTTVACVVASSTSGCTDSGLTNGTIYYYKIFTADKYANYSTGTVPSGNPFTPNASSPPTVSNVVLNGGSAITLTPATTTPISVVASTTAGTNAILYATSTIYRSGVSGGAGCAANDLNCYQLPSTSCAFSGSTTTVTCAANIWYFANATDASSSYNGQTWSVAVTVTDAGAFTGASSTAGVTLNTMLAISLNTSTINYGLVYPSSTFGGNITTTVQNAGNCSSTLDLLGTALLKGANLIATDTQHYATTTFTYGTGDTALSDNNAAVPGFFLIGPTSTAPVQGNVFWGISVPPGTATGTYNGTTTFTAFFSN